MDEDFEIVGKIEGVETIAVGNRIREIARLRKAFGAGRWRKLKGIATVRLEDGKFIVLSFTGTKHTGWGARN
jgi:hypothetical protein